MCLQPLATNMMHRNLHMPMSLMAVCMLLLSLLLLQGPYADMKVLMEEHFAGEERVGLPIFRAHFALKEYQPLQDAINASLSPSHQASFFHAMSSDTRAEFCRLHHIPKVTLVMTILPGMRSFDK
jgi:hypothetical protein